MRYDTMMGIGLMLMAVLCVVMGCDTGSPVALFGTSVVSGEAPLTVIFTDLSSLGVGTEAAWAWDFDDGGTSAIPSPTHTFAVEGTYIVTLVVTTSLGSSSSTQTIVVSTVPGEGEGEGEGEGWPMAANEYSWDGGWAPMVVPPVGLFDDVYFDGHEVGGAPSPILPPGAWDTDTVELYHWTTTFLGNFGDIEGVFDLDGNQFGWLFVPNAPTGQLINYWIDNNYEGSSGMDFFDLGPEGAIRDSAGFRLGDGPDMVRYRYCSAASWRTGSDVSGGVYDNDLVIGGSNGSLAAGTFDVRGATVHTGPGRDLVFVNNLERAAIDLGNGGDGRTDTLDVFDGDDMAVLGGNYSDFRVYGGWGSDVVVWRVDEVNQNTNVLAGDIFGGGGWGDAVWNDTGVDRLIMVVPVDTLVIPGQPERTPAGAIEIQILPNYPAAPVPDPPTENDDFTRYTAPSGIGPNGEKTVTMQYISASEHVRTGEISLNSIEELQVGVGVGAKVYRIDQVNGVATFDASLAALTPPLRETYNALMDTFLE